MPGICGIVAFDGGEPRAREVEEMAAGSPWRGTGRVRLASSPGACFLYQPRTGGSAALGGPLARDGLLAVADFRLDNRRELQRDLDPDRRLAQADGDLLIQAFQRWGEGCADRLRGDFAFALWDGRRRRLYCARDGLGLKRIHYHRLGDRLLFATDAQQILRHPRVERRLNQEVFAQVLAGDLGEERETLFKGVHRLQPGHLLVADGIGDRPRRYWDFDPERRLILPSVEKYAENLAEILYQAVKDRLQSTGHVAAAELSGGLDSSSVAALAAEIAGSRGHELVGLSYVSDLLPECDERQYSRMVAARWSIPVEQVLLESHWLLEDRAAFTPELETPFMAWPSAQRALYSRALEQGARVILTGHGGDEMTIGSPLVYLDWLRRGDLPSIVRSIRREAALNDRSVLKLVRRRLLAPVTPSWARRMWRRLRRKRHPERVPAWMDRGFARHTGLRERLERHPVPGRSERARRDRAQRILRESSGSWMGFLSDLVSGPLGVDVRHPFLDRRLAEFVLSVPGEFLWGAGESKALLRRAMAGRLPLEVLGRRDKASFRSYMAESMRRQVEHLVGNLSDSSAPLTRIGAVDCRRLRAELARYLSGEPASLSDTELWIMICSSIWLRKHWMGR